MKYRYLFPGMPDYPSRLQDAWTAQLPVLTVSGRTELLGQPIVGLLSSSEIPPDLILPAFDLAVALKHAPVAIAGGFQGEAERILLSVLLGGSGPLIVCPARSLDGMTATDRAAERMAAGTMAYVSAERDGVRRPTGQVAMRRNDLIVGLGGRLIVLSAPPGSRVLKSATASLEMGRSVACFDHRRNRDLLLLGAIPIPPSGWMAHMQAGTQKSAGTGRRTAEGAGPGDQEIEDPITKLFAAR